jgi:hypothetical protein
MLLDVIDQLLPELTILSLIKLLSKGLPSINRIFMGNIKEQSECSAAIVCVCFQDWQPAAESSGLEKLCSSMLPLPAYEIRGSRRQAYCCFIFSTPELIY